MRLSEIPVNILFENIEDLEEGRIGQAIDRRMMHKIRQGDFANDNPYSSIDKTRKNARITAAAHLNTQRLGKTLGGNTLEPIGKKKLAKWSVEDYDDQPKRLRYSQEPKSYRLSRIKDMRDEQQAKKDKINNQLTTYQNKYGRR